MIEKNDQISSRSVAFAASTLPIELLNKYMGEWRVESIVLSSRLHLPSYKYLLQDKPGTAIKVLEDSLVVSVIQLFLFLVKIKITNKKVIFFHECGWPWFDLFVTLLKLQGVRIPQINNAGRMLVSYDLVEHSSLFAKALKLFRLHTLFHIYAQANDGGQTDKYFFSMKKYPSSITVYDEKYSRQLIIQKQRLTVSKQRQIILLINRDFVADEMLIASYNRIIDFALYHKFQCYIKDHPSISGRLNLKHTDVTYIDPALPVELLDDNFILAFGFATAGLLFFSERAISIIDTLKEVREEDRQLKMQHLKSVPGGQKIRFIKNLDDELEAVFHEIHADPV